MAWLNEPGMSKPTKRAAPRPSKAPAPLSPDLSDVALIHLSDLHIGRTNRFSIDEPRLRKLLGVRFGRAIKSAAQGLALTLERAIVMVTGDLTNTGDSEEFSWAVEILQSLGGELGIGNHQFVFCPGNHDIDWLECQIAELESRKHKLKPTEARTELDRRKLDNYRQFLKAFHGDGFDVVARPILREARRQDFEDLRVSVVALNACERESHKKSDHMGAVSPEQAQAVLDNWLTSKENWIRILCVHHNPDRTAPANLAETEAWLVAQKDIDPESAAKIIADIAGFEGRDNVRRIAEDAHVSLLLHGHQHESDVRSWKWSKDGETLIIASGSAAADKAHLPGEEPNQMRLISISPKDNVIRAIALVWDPRARQKGSVELGDFVSGAGERDDYKDRVFIPPGYVTARTTKRALVTQKDIRIQEFLAAYRQRLAHAWADWDLKGMAAVGGMGRPEAAGLDEMYQPLRLGTPGSGPGKTLGAGDLLKGKAKALLIRGPAGAGKTTWMRFTFRRLLQDKRAVPFMLVLRDVAARWSHPDYAGQARSLDACIRDSVAERMGEGWNPEIFLRTLTATEGPEPILMIDGWDEIGDHGRKLRELLLGFMQQHRRVRIVVSTRPWGDGVPDGAHGFSVLEIQPLSEPEVESFARRFFQVCYRLDENAVAQELPRFLERLQASGEAKALASTALFLTMMLVVSRHRALPDKRHQLYRECLTTLLTDRPDTWAREGVQRNPEWWRPEDAEHRLKAVAQLAAELQAKGYAGVRKAVIASEADIVGALPITWNVNQRRGFLWWLIGEAGLITDRSDGTYTFAHLSFQEYLTAWHLHASVSDGNWASPVLARIGSESWWETLLLYAAVVGSTSDARASAIVDALVEREGDGLTVAGMILADGGGSDLNAEQWSATWAKAHQWYPGPLGSGRCAAAWAGSQQTARREILEKALLAKDAMPSTRWWHWERLAKFARQAKLSTSEPTGVLPSLLFKFKKGGGAPEDLGVGRIIATRVKIDRPEWLLLQWPSRRRRLSMRLQSAIVAGAPHAAIIRIAQLFMRDEPLPGWRATIKDWAALRKESGFQGIRHMESILVHSLRILLAEHDVILSPDFAGRLFDDAIHLLGPEAFADRPQMRNRLFDRGRHSLYLEMDGQAAVRESLLAYASANGSFFESGPWLLDHLRLEIATAYQLIRPWVSSGQGIPAEALLMSWATNHLLGHVSPYPKHLVSVHPLWHALARHLTGRATEDDRILLIKVASHPDDAIEAPLSWALQYVVRGDLVLENGSTVMLDDFLRDSEVPSLPMLDGPEELEAKVGIVDAQLRARGISGSGP